MAQSHGKPRQRSSVVDNLIQSWMTGIPASTTEKKTSMGYNFKPKGVKREPTSGPQFSNIDTPQSVFGTEDGREATFQGRPRFGTSTTTPDLEAMRLFADRYAEAMAKSTRDKYKLPSMVTPKFKTGGDWHCFLSEFKDMVTLSDLKPSLQMAYLKQAVPEEAKKMLYQHKVENVEEALEMLTELYEPTKDSWTALQELQQITQRSGERFRLLAGRIKDATEPIKLPARELDELVKSRFKHAIADPETRNLLLWEAKDLKLEELIKKAQTFEDTRQAGKAKPKKTLRATEENSETSTLRREVSELKKQLESIKPGKSSQKDKSGGKKPVCWNCGQRGHLSRVCRQEKVGDGFTHRPKRGKDRGREKQDSKTQPEDLNGNSQGE